MPRDSLTVAAVQLCSAQDVAQNLAACEAQAQRAAEAGAQVVVLPENFAYFGDEAGKRAAAETLGQGLIQDRLATLAQRQNIYLLGGGMPERSEDPERPYNTAVLFGPDGNRVASYRKVHLFDVDLASGSAYRESASTTAGDAAVVVEIEGFRVGLSICYDLRFSGLFAALAERAAEVFVVPAAFTAETGRAHWHVLLRARAVEWQTWIIAAAQHGEHPGARRTFGHSLVADPWGEVVAEHAEGVGYCLATLTKARLAEVRRRLPCLQHRRDVLTTDAV